jgi:hypothetical protein
MVTLHSVARYGLSGTSTAFPRRSESPPGGSMRVVVPKKVSESIDEKEMLFFE